MTYKYIFSDGYFCFTFGRMSLSDIYQCEKEHGKLYTYYAIR